MAEKSKPEINLEISSGFFRITADDAIYNITVLGGGEDSSASRVVEKIVEVERAQAAAPPPPPPAAAGAADRGEGYYKQVSSDLYRDIGNLAKSLSSTMMHIPMEDRRMKRVELDEAGEKIEDAKSQLQDIVKMTESATMDIMDSVESIQEQTDSVKGMLSFLKDHVAFQARSEEGETGETGEAGDSLRESVDTVRGMVSEARQAVAALLEIGSAAPAAAAEEAPTAAAGRYLFSIDTIFQTIYELCTNETVKGHITTAREQAGELFDTEAFLAALNAKVEGLEPDSDNFFNVPLSDVLAALREACSEKKIQNLLAKMDANQQDIFLDQTLPLEVPEWEAGSPAEPAPPPEAPAGLAVDSGRLEELAGQLDRCLAEIDRLSLQAGRTDEGVRPGAENVMTPEHQAEIFRKIEDAFAITTKICTDISRITEALSFQDLSGQQILKIIKLLSDFQIQLLAIVVSFGSQLKHKEQNAELTAEEGKRLAQEEVDSYFNQLNAPQTEGEGGVLDQDAVNKLLGEMGF